MINNNILPYMRKDISTLVTLSAAAIGVLMLASPVLPLSNPLLLQPAQAQTNLSFRTPIPANGTDSTQGNALTFDAQGETFISSERLEANGTYQITDSSSGQVLSSGSISRVQGCCLSNPSNGDKITILAGPGDNTQILTSCSTSASNNIGVGGDNYFGPVECSSSSSSQGGGDTTAQPSSSSMTGTTTQDGDRGSSSDSNSRDGDSDGDGIPDSSDNCAHNNNPRCYKEGDASTTTSTTSHQQQPSSSNRTGNQTR
jgi:hypothetical protein